MVKGVQRDFPLARVWGCPPALKKSPKIGGYRGLINTYSINLPSARSRYHSSLDGSDQYCGNPGILNGLLSFARAHSEDKSMSVKGVIHNDGGSMAPIDLAVRKA